MRRLTHVLVFALVLLSGCAGPAEVAVEQPVEEPTGPTRWDQVETVDVAQYPDEMPQAEVLVHDVPAALMNSTADDGSMQTLSGYRVQVFSSSEREEAASVDDDVVRWLATLSEGQRNAMGLSESVEVYTLFLQPFFRVRVGDFERRDAAQRAADGMKRRFPSALVVPDEITIIR